MCDIKTILFIKNKTNNKIVNIIDKYYDTVITININYLNTKQIAKISIQTPIMYLSSLLKLPCDQCRFYINNNVCKPYEKLIDYKRYINSNLLTINCIVSSTFNLNLNKLVTLYLDNKKLDSDIYMIKICSLYGPYFKFINKNPVINKTDLEIHLSNNIDSDIECFIRQKLSRCICIKNKNELIPFNYKWINNLVLKIYSINTFHEIYVNPIVVDKELVEKTKVSVLESYIFEEIN
jgi:hypothetical protein